MLTLYRRRGEKIIIGEGENMITITYLGMDDDRIKLGFDAPRHISVDREEIRLKKSTVNRR